MCNSSEPLFLAHVFCAVSHLNACCHQSSNTIFTLPELSSLCVIQYRKIQSSCAGHSFAPHPPTPPGTTKSLNSTVVFWGVAEFSLEIIFLKKIFQPFFCAYICSISGRKFAFMYVSPAIPMDSSPGIQSSLGISSESKAEQKLYQSLFGHVTLGSHDITWLGFSIHTIGVRPTSGALSSWLCVSILTLGTREHPQVRSSSYLSQDDFFTLKISSPSFQGLELRVHVGTLKNVWPWAQPLSCSSFGSMESGKLRWVFTFSAGMIKESLRISFRWLWQNYTKI